MAYLDRGRLKRADLELVLPGARSVIVLAINYDPAGGTAIADPPALPGVIARYARHRDYHDLLAQPLQLLAGQVNQLGGPGDAGLCGYRADPRTGSGPTRRDRFHRQAHQPHPASRRQLVAPGRDSDDARAAARCARAQPLWALHAVTSTCPPRRSAPSSSTPAAALFLLTIELRGPIPTELRPAIGQRIFGCDDCLAVCPLEPVCPGPGVSSVIRCAWIWCNPTCSNCWHSTVRFSSPPIPRNACLARETSGIAPQCLQSPRQPPRSPCPAGPSTGRPRSRARGCRSGTLGARADSRRPDHRPPTTGSPVNDHDHGRDRAAGTPSAGAAGAS